MATIGKCLVDTGSEFTWVRHEILESLGSADHRAAMTGRIDRMEAGGGLDEAEMKARLHRERSLEL